MRISEVQMRFLLESMRLLHGLLIIWINNNNNNNNNNNDNNNNNN